jgi:hypothetical protein
MRKDIDFAKIRRAYFWRAINACEHSEVKTDILLEYTNELIDVINWQDNEIKKLQERDVKNIIEDDIRKLAIKSIARHGMKYIVLCILIVCTAAYFKVEAMSTIVALVGPVTALVSGVLMSAMTGRHDKESKEADSKIDSKV